MNSDRIKELQEQTAYPESVSVYKALLQVWNECQQEHNEQLRLHSVMYWRDIDKEMPPEHEKVLVLLPDDIQLMAQIDSNGGWGIYWADGQKPMDNDRPVLKWMPLSACI